MTLVLLTGATRGIGQAAAIELASQGAELALVGREADRVEAVAQEAAAAGGGSPVHQYVADLTLMADVRRLAEEVRGRHEHIDVLANNAGALFATRRDTAEGLERTFALNHLAPFLLTNLLRDRLSGGRVVTTTSDAHEAGRLDLDDLQSEKSYSAMRVYGTSKLCNILFTRELARRAPELHANCFHPGTVRTGFRQDRERDLEGADHDRRPLLPLTAARRALPGLARPLGRRRRPQRRVRAGREGGKAERSGAGRRAGRRPVGAQRRAGGPTGGQPRSGALSQAVSAASICASMSFSP